MCKLLRIAISTLSVFILFIIPSNSHAATSITDDVDTNTTWVLASSPYVIENSIDILSGATLTIEPGVVIKFVPSSSFFKSTINVSGKIVANGTQVNPIHFTSSYDDTIGGDTDNYQSCYEPTDEYGNVIGGEVCETYDSGDPSVEDWGEIYFNNSNGSTLKNAFTRYNKYGLALYQSTVDFENVNISESKDALTIYESSRLNFSNLNISNIYDDPVAIFNDSSFMGDKLKVENIFSNNTDVIVVFNHSKISLKDSIFKNCPNEACLTIFDGSSYLATPSDVNIEKTIFDGGLGSGVLTFSNNDIPINIKNSVFKNFNLFAVENYSSLTTINAKNNDWGDSSGPYHGTLNTEGKGQKIYGLVDFDPWVGKEADTPEVYFAKITNIPDGVAKLYDAPTASATLVKTLPNDWIVKVLDKKDVNNQPMISNGYHWYKVEDPTDNTIHYMFSGVDDEPIYLPYEKDKQVEYENKSVDNLSGGTTVQILKRKNVVLEAIDYYYNNNETKKSLYSSDDNIKISKLKIKNFPKDLIRAFTAVEIAGEKFDNENVSGDYGHGMMQLTIKTYEKVNKNYDNRGLYSKVSMRKCLNNPTSPNDYKKCYTPILNSKGKVFKQLYDHYEDISTNPIYKNYANTTQSIYSNIKDGLGILSNNYGNIINNPCTQNWTTSTGLVITCEEVNIIKDIWGYNGASIDAPDYLGVVSNRLKNLSTYFPGYTYNNSDKMIEKLAYAGKNRIELKKHSPITIYVKDSYGHITGETNGGIDDSIPYSDYNPESETAVIFFPHNTYTYQVVGDSTGGFYGLDIDNYNNSDTSVSFNASDLPIAPGEIHTYSVDEIKLANGNPDAVIIKIDTNGDGIIEKTMKTGSKLTSTEPYDFYFKKLVDGGNYKIGKNLEVKIKVIKDKGAKKIKIPKPEIKITRVSDGYVLPIKDKSTDEDDDEDNDDRKYYKNRHKEHDKNYKWRISKNTLTEGEWKVEVKLGGKVQHSIIINMVK